MNQRIHLKFEHPLATHGASWISRTLLSFSHLFLGFNALQFFMGNISPYILGALLLLAIEILRRNPDAKPYIRELYLRAGLQIFILTSFIGTTYALNFKVETTVVKGFHMVMFLFMFLNLYEAGETFRGRIPIRVLNKNK